MSIDQKRFRWFRFRLRTVLLLVTLLAIPCAWIGSEWKLVHKRAALIERIEAAGGGVLATKIPSRWITQFNQGFTPSQSRQSGDCSATAMWHSSCSSST